MNITQIPNLMKFWAELKLVSEYTNFNEYSLLRTMIPTVVPSLLVILPETPKRHLNCWKS